MTPAAPLVLASRSPRRASLLREAGIAFEVVVPPDREAAPGEILHLSPAEITLLNASRKACPLARAMPGRLILGVDTEVAIGAAILGKPRDLGHARAMLASLAGRVHHVHSGVVLARACGPRLEILARLETTRVRFRPLTAEGIDAYLARVHVLDKAGAYAAQEDGGQIIESVSGLMSNVIGLPVERLPGLLAAFARGGLAAGASSF